MRLFFFPSAVFVVSVFGACSGGQPGQPNQPGQPGQPGQPAVPTASGRSGPAPAVHVHAAGPSVHNDPNAASAPAPDAVPAPDGAPVEPAVSFEGLTPEQEVRAAAAHAEHLAANGHVAPIDCPLRAAGIDPHGLKPFKEVDAYIAFLERPDRATWQRPDAVVEALDLKGDETVVDVGAGSGYFSFRLADALPQGQVVALDIEPEMVRHVHHKAMTTGVDNLRAVVIAADDPAPPADADLVLVCDVLHHVQARAAWIGKLTAPLAAGARVVVIEFKEGELPQGPPAGLKLSREALVALFTGAGLKLVDEKPSLLPYQLFLVFEKPAPPAD